MLHKEKNLRPHFKSQFCTFLHFCKPENPEKMALITTARQRLGKLLDAGKLWHFNSLILELHEWGNSPRKNIPGLLVMTLI